MKKNGYCDDKWWYYSEKTVVYCGEKQLDDCDDPYLKITKFINL